MTLYETVKGVASLVRAEIQYRADGWLNTAMGFGNPNTDKTALTHFGPGCELQDMTLTDMYRFDDVARKIVEIPPRDAVSGGFKLTGLDPENAEKADEYLKRFCVGPHILDAWIWDRLYGGSAIWPVVEDGRDLTEPLDLESISTVHKLMVLDRRFLIPETYYTAGSGAKVGEPEIYNLVKPSNGTGSVFARIHESRLIVFQTIRTELETKIRKNNWGDNILQIVYDALRSSGGIRKSIELLVSDANQGVFGIKDLFAQIASGQGGHLMERIRIMDMTRSAGRAILLDKDNESFARVTSTFTGLADLDDKAWNRIASAAEIPVTRFVGQAPAGLQATGASDMEAYDIKIKNERRDQIDPLVLRLLGILFAAADAPKLVYFTEDEAAWDKAEPAEGEEGLELDDGDTDGEDLEPSEERTDDRYIADHLRAHRNHIARRYPGLGKRRVRRDADPQLPEREYDDVSDEEEGSIADDSELEEDEGSEEYQNPGKLGIEWLPTRQATPSEESELRLKRAQEAKIWVDMQAMLPEEAILSCADEHGWKINKKAREGALKDDFSGLKDQQMALKEQEAAGPPGMGPPGSEGEEEDGGKGGGTPPGAKQ